MNRRDSSEKRGEAYMISQLGHCQIPTLFDVLNTSSGEEGFMQVGHDASSSLPVNSPEMIVFADSISAGIISLSSANHCSSALAVDEAGRACALPVFSNGRLDTGVGVTSLANLGNPF